MKLSEIKPNPDNPRVIKTDKFYQLVESVKNSPSFLKHNKIVVDEGMMILAGNQRYRAALEAKMKSVPVTIFTREDSEENNIARKAQGNQEATYEEQCREYVIKDNAHNGEWDWDMLGNGWSDDPLIKWGLDVWTPETDVDYSILDEEDFSGRLDEMEGDVRRALQIPFESGDYEEAKELYKKCIDDGMYVGGMVIEALKNKAK